jgi:hypothetical protein
MQLDRLAASQKRLKDLTEFANLEVRDANLKQLFTQTLQRYRNALASCWRSQQVSPEDSALLDSIERDLDTLFSQAHLRTATR